MLPVYGIFLKKFLLQPHSTAKFGLLTARYVPCTLKDGQCNVSTILYL